MRTVTVTPRRPFSGKIKGAIQRILDYVRILDNVVVFPEEIEAEYGTFIAGSSVLVGAKRGGQGELREQLRLRLALQHLQKVHSPEKSILIGTLTPLSPVQN
ncbi:hypothetical protein [Thermococcus sp.]|uniref:hypothetical protein n=1 Tax=Thermococcus sp. TaxID=35749 RepID=UPI002612C507|nr:hypothetical protein [Thermococcus sp.]